MTLWFLGGGGSGWSAQPHVGASAGSKDVALGDGFRWVYGKGCRYLKKAYMEEELEVPEKEGSRELVSFHKHCEVPPTLYPSEMMFRACSQFFPGCGLTPVFGYLLDFYSLTSLFCIPSSTNPGHIPFFLLCFIILQQRVSNHKGGRPRFCLNSWYRIANITL